MYFILAGIPSMPSITSLSLTQSDVTINWMIDIHELRPVDRYIIQVQITGSNDQELNSGDNQTTGANGASFGGSSNLREKQEFNVTILVADLNCSVNTRGDINHCEYTLTQETETGVTYSFIVCAINDFGTTCGESKNITAYPLTTMITSTSAPPPLVTLASTLSPQPTPASSTGLTPASSGETLVPQRGTLTMSTTQPLATPDPLPPKRGPKTPTGLEGKFVGIVFCVVVVVLLCCVLWVSVVLLCVCCLRREREKKYWPEEKGEITGD